jgi:hypothetical protein
VNGKIAILDSNIIIYLSKGVLESAEFEKYESIAVSIITYMEVLGYRFHSAGEESIIRKMLDMMEIIPISMEIADITIELRKSMKLKLPDAIILATAKKSGAVLYTANDKDFGLFDKIEIINPLKI